VVARRAVPSLVLTDVMMPNLDGFGLLRALREDPRTRSVPVVMLSARAGEESRVEGLSRGADDYLIKPFSAKELVTRVRTHLELGRLRLAAETERSRLVSLLEQAPAAITVLRGPTFIYEVSNARHDELVQRRDLIGKTVAEAFPGPESDAIREILHRVFTTGERHVGSEMLVKLRRMADGEPVDAHFDFVYDPFRAADGSVEGIMVIAFEVTDRVQSDQKLRKARADAERASRAKDEFLAMLGHELRNPLAPIVATLQLLRLRGGDAGARERTIIERQVKHLTTLVDDLLDVSAITRGKIELKRERLELRLLVDRAIEIASPLMVQRDHDLIVEVPPVGLQVDVDPLRIAQVLSNLLTNAAKYTDPGGRIVVSAQALGGEVELRVTDNGIGISAQMLPHVFELFVQERQAIDRVHGGLGLGLAIVQNMMALHGGNVSVTSVGPGHGSTFTIRLPATEVRAGEQRVEMAEPSRAAGQTAVARQVLIVDDNQDAAQMLALVMEDLGWETRIAYDGPSALAVAESYRPQLVLIDIGLPLMDGYELARHLRARPSTAKARLVAVTGYGQKNDVEAALEAGFDQHLVKPVQFEKLESLLQFAPLPQPTTPSS
jgi:PAS domain S-box-containing protein